ncbi:MAG: YceI family protein [Bacteroidales bacterium]|nr:YceI family protein [Bacteroidales bacterium]
MKRKNVMFSMVLVSILILVSCSQSGQKKAESASKDDSVSITSVTINPAESRLVWSGEALGVYTHTGTLKLSQAELALKDGKISGGSFTADMKSIVPTDANYDPEKGSTKEKLVGHLSSPDFFDVENYPTATFVITSVEGNTATGTLTVRGISNEEKVENIEIIHEGEKVKITGDLVFNRKTYNVSWDYPMKDMILSKDISVKVELLGS